MKKLLLVFTLILFVFTSCLFNTDDTDKVKPTISISFKDGDTLFISDQKINKFIADLQDNESISTFKLHLKCLAKTREDSISYATDSQTIDSVAIFNKVIYLKSFGYIQNINLADSFLIAKKTNYLSNNYSVKTGDSSLYQLVVGCVDRAGNYDSVVYKVNLCYPDTIKK